MSSFNALVAGNIDLITVFSFLSSDVVVNEMLSPLPTNFLHIYNLFYHPANILHMSDADSEMVPCTASTCREIYIESYTERFRDL